MMLRRFPRSLLAAACGAALLAAMPAGCGGRSDTPELGRVYGTVKLDGEPLPDASIRFQPLESGRLALASTNAKGEYELQYTESARGALLGKHVVRIHTAREATDESEAVPEKVPVQYNRDALDNPEMQVEIKPGNNEFNFELTSEGRKIQPPTADGPPPGGI